MSKVKFSRRRDALFKTVKLTICENTYKLKWNGSVEIDLPNGTYDVCLRADFWCHANYKINVTEEENSYIVSQTMPDWYFWISGIILLVLFILSILDVIHPLFFFAPLAVYFIPLMINLFVNRSKYFNIEIKQ